MLAESSKTPFVAVVIILLILVLKELIVLFIDRIVGQMHIPVILVDLLSVSLRCKSSQSLLVHIHLHWLVASYKHIDPKVKLVTVDQQRICDVFTNDRGLIHVHVIYVIDKVDSSSLAGISRLHDPHIFLTFVLLQFLVVVVEISELIRQDVGIRTEIESRFSEALLHAHYIEAQSVFSCNLITLREVIDFLVLIQTLILV